MKSIFFWRGDAARASNSEEQFIRARRSDRLGARTRLKNKRSTAWRGSLETLEPRLPMTASTTTVPVIDYSPAIAALAQLTLNSASTTTSSTVNTSNLSLAITAAVQHLSSILDPNNGDIPYFTISALSSSQAGQYGDPNSGTAKPSMSFNSSFTSNVIGRAVYALLLAQSSGAQVDPGVLATYESLLLKSLNKPIDGNYNNTAASNQLLTGLAADPTTYGSQIFNFVHLYNVGAGLRGALGLATLTADPNATLAGYSESGLGLMEQAIDNLQQWYVYNGTIGGTRVYSWEQYRKHFGLQGSNTPGTTVDKSWSGEWQGWTDPFLLYDIVKFYQATGYQPALELAKELRDQDFYQRFPLDPAAVPISSFTHMYEAIAEMDAYSGLALALNDADMMRRVQVRYEVLRQQVFGKTGWVPEDLGDDSDTGEANNTGELIETALNFAKFGWTQYYGDVERFTRGQLLPSQLLSTSFIQSNNNPSTDGQANLQTRLIGAFGFPAPYGSVATLNPDHTGDYFSDITTGALASLLEIEKAAYSNDDGVHTINLLFSLDSEDITIVSPYDNNGQLTITLKTAGDVRIRLPDWANLPAMEASLDSQHLSYSVTSGYLQITGAPVNSSFSVAMPLKEQWDTDTVNGRQITIVWKGDSVEAMSNEGSPMPFFPDPSTIKPAQTTTEIPNQPPLYANNLGGSLDDESRAIVVDHDGNTYVVGTWNYADGAEVSTSTQSSDIFLAKYDVNGNLLWQHVIGSSGDDRAYGAALDSAGNVIVTGLFQGTVDFNPDSGTALLKSKGGSDIFVAKYDGSGNYLWAKSYGGSSSIADAGFAVTVDSHNSIFVTGQFAGTVNFDPQAKKALSVKNAGNSDAFILKLNSSGGTVWAKRFGATMADRGEAIAVDSSGKIDITGSYGNVVYQRVRGKVTAQTNSDVFVMQLKSTGATAWLQRVGGTGNDEGTSILAVNGGVLIGGHFEGTVDFDPSSHTYNLNSYGGSDAFVLKLDNSGHRMFAEQFGSTGDDGVSGLAQKSDSSLVLSGSFTGEANFYSGGGTVSAIRAGGVDAFVLELDPNGQFKTLQTVGGAGDDRGRAVAIDANNQVFLAGEFSGQAEAGLAVLNGVPLTSNGGKDAFFARMVQDIIYN